MKENLLLKSDNKYRGFIFTDTKISQSSNGFQKKQGVLNKCLIDVKVKVIQSNSYFSYI